VFDEEAALVWAGNMAAIELHAPMALASDLDTPTMLVFDLDPGPPAAMRECCRVGLAVKAVLDAVGLQAVAKTSGSKGLQVYVPLNTPGATHQRAADVALAVGTLLAKQQPDEVVTTMTRSLRPGKVFVDWSQNARFKTTVAVYSLRARERPTVSTPVSWDEVSDGADGRDDLRFEAADVLDRVARLGDLFAPALTVRQELPGG
jgi:bifunctional non-homologous end joining protein LigD